MQETLTKCETKMQKTINALENDFQSLRTGRASAALFNSIMVEYYGTPTPLSQVGSISVPEARMVVIQPWDKSVLSDIEKAILKSDLGLTPNNDGKLIRLNFPPLNEERRRNLVKTAKSTAEQTKVAIRNVRREAMDELKKMQKSGDISEDQQKDAEVEIQKLTDSFSIEVGTLSDAKEKEIMEI